MSVSCHVFEIWSKSVSGWEGYYKYTTMLHNWFGRLGFAFGERTKSVAVTAGLILKQTEMRRTRGSELSQM